MEKKLPGVFVNKIQKKVTNNKSVFYGPKEKEIEEEPKEEKKGKPELTVRQKLNRIFQSVHYIYKVDVEITLKDKKIIKRMIGFNEKDVITFDNELIPIKDIIDVRLVKEE